MELFGFGSAAPRHIIAMRAQAVAHVSLDLHHAKSGAKFAAIRHLHRYSFSKPLSVRSAFATLAECLRYPKYSPMPAMFSKPAEIPELPNYYRGKVRDNYDLPDRRRMLIASDRISAFDRNLAVIPFKGQVLTQTARFWFETARDICPNHVLEYPDPNVVVCRRLTMMPVEIVVRTYLAGTTSTAILQMYKKGGSACTVILFRRA